MKQNKHCTLSNLTYKSPPCFLSRDHTYRTSCPVQHAISHDMCLCWNIIPNAQWCTSCVIREIKICMPWSAQVYSRQRQREIVCGHKVNYIYYNSVLCIDAKKRLGLKPISPVQKVSILTG